MWRTWAMFLPVAAFGALVWPVSVLASAPTPTDAGSVLLYEADRPTQPLVRGDAATPFGLRLPDDAVCPGDSRNDGWRVQGFIVPTDVPMADVEWTVIGATGPDQSLLFTTNGDLFVDELTVANAAAGEPGRIADPPLFSFAAMKQGTLTSGTYRIGIACTQQRQLDRYWDTEIVIEAPADAALAWSTPDAPDDVADSGIEVSSIWVLRGLAIAGLVGALVYLVRSRRRSPIEPSIDPPTPQETHP